MKKFLQGLDDYARQPIGAMALVFATGFVIKLAGAPHWVAGLASLAVACAVVWNVWGRRRDNKTS